MATAAISVTTSATVIRAKNTYRTGIIVDNQSAVTVYLGDDSSLTTANGITLAAGDKFIMAFDGGIKTQFFFRGDIYGIVASGTADVRVWEMVEVR